ncbi:hypothetical protein K490DRAFT_41426 [Saccharata proteae CBS 121410]|uniref:Uncharacterized protein n=1 Tax=Saccharata proteae CBS 121410 TaxID=1314787 RepID=A0A9P4LXH2_9PEZI|nr:hypothetical protein K490DRAFT_41426 [Saccharata proteae CBS 121410]
MSSPGDSFAHQRHSSIDFSASPRSRRASSAANQSPVTPRFSHGYAHGSSVADFSELNDDREGSFNGGDGGLGNLADELADADEDEWEGEEDGEGEQRDASFSSPQKEQQQVLPNHIRHNSELPRDSGVELLMSPNSAATLSPSRGSRTHRRKVSQYDGSDYGDSDDLEHTDGISPGLEARMAAIESLARRGMEENGSPADGVVARLTDQLRDLGSQAGVEGGTTRYGTLPSRFWNSKSKLTHLLPLIADTLNSIPHAPSTPLQGLGSLTRSTHDLLASLSYLSDSLHMGRQTSTAAQRRLKLVRDAMGEWRRENELREEGIHWIQKGDWDDRLKSRQAAATCSDVVGGFEEVCNGWRERLVARSEENAVTA